jgi:hypothetical protein
MGFTVHGVSEELDRKLAERARREKVSKNQLVKSLLARALGLAIPDRENDDYREFLGLWSRSEKEAFDRRQEGNRRIDEEDWR